jgi:hypothetical protein
MAKSSLYAAHRAAGAASGKYKASLYDIANIGYAMEADIGIEKYKESRRQEGWQTLQQALAVADTAYGSYQSSQRHEEMMGKSGAEKPPSKSKSFYGEKAGFDLGDIWGEKSIWKGKPTIESKKAAVKATTPKKKLPEIGTKANPFVLAGKGAKAVGDLFRQAKEAGIKEGSNIWGQIGDEVKEWSYVYK